MNLQLQACFPQSERRKEDFYGKDRCYSIIVPTIKIGTQLMADAITIEIAGQWKIPLTQKDGEKSTKEEII